MAWYIRTRNLPYFHLLVEYKYWFFNKFLFFTYVSNIFINIQYLADKSLAFLDLQLTTLIIYRL